MELLLVHFANMCPLSEPEQLVLVMNEHVPLLLGFIYITNIQCMLPINLYCATELLLTVSVISLC